MKDNAPAQEEQDHDQVVDWSPRDQVPDGWYADPKRSTIWFTVYKVLGVTQANLQETFRIFDLPMVRGVFSYGTVGYIDFGRVSPHMTDDGRYIITHERLQGRRTPTGCHLHLITPHVVDGKPANEAETRQRIQTAVGLLTAILGRNVVYARVTENELRLSDGTITGWGPVMDNPQWFAVPDINGQRLAFIESLGEAIAALPIRERNRIELSLRWLEGALYESGIDALLKYWIAIEALVMPDTTNVRPMNERLMAIYALPDHSRANDTFFTGRLQGLRSQVIHNGLIVPINANLLRYLEALYCDLLLGVLNLPTERRAQTVLQVSGFDLGAYLEQLAAAY